MITDDYDIPAFEDMGPETFDAFNKTYARVNRLFLDLREVEAITWRPFERAPEGSQWKLSVRIHMKSGKNHQRRMDKKQLEGTLARFKNFCKGNPGKSAAFFDTAELIEEEE
jgi:hypothetical protein